MIGHILIDAVTGQRTGDKSEALVIRGCDNIDAVDLCFLRDLLIFCFCHQFFLIMFKLLIGGRPEQGFAGLGIDILVTDVQERSRSGRSDMLGGNRIDDRARLAESDQAALIADHDMIGKDHILVCVIEAEEEADEGNEVIQAPADELPLIDDDKIIGIGGPVAHAAHSFPERKSGAGRSERISESSAFLQLNFLSEMLY